MIPYVERNLSILNFETDSIELLKIWRDPIHFGKSHVQASPTIVAFASAATMWDIIFIVGFFTMEEGFQKSCSRATTTAAAVYMV